VKRKPNRPHCITLGFFSGFVSFPSLAAPIRSAARFSPRGVAERFAAANRPEGWNLWLNYTLSPAEPKQAQSTAARRRSEAK